MTYDEQATGLTQSTTYYYCAVASNSQGTVYGAVLSFTTDGPPSVTTASATVSGTSVTLNGSGTPYGADTTGWFEYSTTNPGTCTASFGTRVPASGGTDLSTGFTGVYFGQSLTGLPPVTTYYYCALDSNAYGTAYGAVVSFTTGAALPLVVSDGASGTSGTTATLTGYTNPEGADTIGFFRYSTTNPGTCNNTFGTPVPATGGTDLGRGHRTWSTPRPSLD